MACVKNTEASRLKAPKVLKTHCPTETVSVKKRRMNALGICRYHCRSYHESHGTPPVQANSGYETRECRLDLG